MINVKTNYKNTNHAQGVTAPKSGVLEVMLDRRPEPDDKRGMEEGINDNIENVQKYWITLEFLDTAQKSSKSYQVPTIHTTTLSYLLNYPISVFINSLQTDLRKRVEFLTSVLPCDIHLMNLRTMTSKQNNSLPSTSSLLIIYRQELQLQVF